MQTPIAQYWPVRKFSIAQSHYAYQYVLRKFSYPHDDIYITRDIKRHILNGRYIIEEQRGVISSWALDDTYRVEVEKGSFLSRVSTLQAAEYFLAIDF